MFLINNTKNVTYPKGGNEGCLLGKIIMPPLEALLF